MRYWRVNPNQTYKQELGGGYVWSPKRNANSARNPFYESMREVAQGDFLGRFQDEVSARLLGTFQTVCNSVSPDKLPSTLH
jgi:hypothetical protein